MLYPFKFQPIYKEKIWGGSNLKKYLDKNINSHCKIGESWEIADHFEDTSVIENGELKGTTLSQILQEYKRDLLGSKPDKKYLKKFPLLIKFIDANDKLSVQVHPDDAYAGKKEKGESGKTEIWYIVHAEPNARLIAGLEPGTTKKKFKRKLEENKLEDIFYYVKVNTGDVIFIPSGRLHAITPGLIINEIQQNSDVTYRVYDWGRKGFNGKPRELHIEKSLDVINFKDYAPSVSQLNQSNIGNNVFSILTRCLYFQVEKYILNEKIKFESDESSFNIISIINGNGLLCWEKKEIEIGKGETILIPACISTYAIYPQTALTIIKSNI